MQIPNDIVSKSQILNYTYFLSRRLELAIKVPYSQNLFKIEQLLLESAKDNNKVLKEPQPWVQNNKFLDNGFEIYLFCWVANEDFGIVTHQIIQAI